MTESVTITLFDQANTGVITDSGESFAIVCLVLVGISPERSAEVVADAWKWIRKSVPPAAPAE